MTGPALLFCPGDRPDRFRKATAAADTVILDLEDAVALADKPSAREAVRESDLDPATTIVRVNPAGTGEFAADLDALSATAYRTVMLAKAETTEQLDELAAGLCGAGAVGGLGIVALCETAIGVQNAPELARHPSVVALMWGAEDLVASLGGRSSRRAEGAYRDVARYARSRVLLAAGSAGTAAIDAVHLDIADLDGLREEALDAAAVGFAATACIHPSQVPVIREAYAPTPEELDWAERLLATAEREPGVFRFEGRMVDEPVLRHARRIRTAAPAN